MFPSITHILGTVDRHSSLALGPKGHFGEYLKARVRVEKARPMYPWCNDGPRGSKYPKFEVSGSKTILFMVFGTRVLKIGYLDPLMEGCLVEGAEVGVGDSSVPGAPSR